MRSHLYDAPRAVTFTETEGRRWGPGAGGQEWDLALDGEEFPIGKMKKAWR